VINRPSPFSFTDFREYLRAFVAAARPQGLSLRELSRRAGLSPGFLPLVLAGKRRLFEDALEKIVPHLGLDLAEAKYLRILRQMSEANTSLEREAALKKAKKLSGFRSSQPLNFSGFEFLSHWFYPVIRELSAAPGFKLDAEWIQGRLNKKIKRRDIEQAIAFLIEQKMIEKNNLGAWVFPNRETLTMDSAVAKAALAKFHSEMLGQAIESLDSVAREERTVQGLTIGMSPDTYKKAEKILNQALADITQLARDQSDRALVYHVALAAFPVTKKVKTS
jgi:uncharacterized protein (TIGR02147 family)